MGRNNLWSYFRVPTTMGRLFTGKMSCLQWWVWDCLPTHSATQNKWYVLFILLIVSISMNIHLSLQPITRLPFKFPLNHNDEKQGLLLFITYLLAHFLASISIYFNWEAEDAIKITLERNRSNQKLLRKNICLLCTGDKGNIYSHKRK